MPSSILSINFEDMKSDTIDNLTKQSKQDLNQVIEKDESLEQQLVQLSAKLRQLEDKNVDLRAQLLIATEKKKSDAKSPAKEHPAIDDVKQMYDQLKYKDNRIIDLNNVILEKERRIMDLQEAYREQGQVAQSKQQAVQIVNRRLQELDGREVRHVSTEVDPSLFSDRTPRRSARNQSTDGSTQSFSRKSDRNESPGRAIPQFKLLGSSGSPPPIDPSEDMASYTTETLNMGSMAQQDRLDESSFEADLIAPLDISPGMSPKQLRKYQRKRVTFDLHQQPNKRKTSSVRQSPPIDVKSDVDDFLQPLNKSKMVANSTEDYDYADLVVENDQLRKIIAEMEKNATASKTADKKNENVRELEKMIQQSQHDTKIQVLKARAATQARVKELEATIAGMQSSTSKEVETLKAINETLKTSREWTLNENGHLLKKISDMTTKLEDLHGELDASLNTNTMFRNRLEEEEKRLEAITQELIQSRRHAQQMTEEKQILLSETERLKEALVAQDEFISMLEGDIIVYEAHVGLLKDSLGASKREDRQVIKSKAFTAKLNALEMEKQEIAKRNNDERLRIKALNVKVRCLEQERDELGCRLRYYEHEYGANRNQPLPSVVAGTDARRQSTEDNTAPQNVLSPPNAQEVAKTPLVKRLNSIEEPHPSRLESTKEDHSQCEDQLKLVKLEYEKRLQHERDAQMAQKQEKENVLHALHQLQQEELKLKSQLSDFEEIYSKLEVDLQESQQTTSAFHILLSDVMSSILGNVAECCEDVGESIPTASFQDNELLDKLKHVGNAVDSTLHSLLDELTKMKTEKESMKEQLELAKWAVSEMEHVGKEVDTLKQQMEQEKQVLEENWQQVKAMLVIKEKELAAMEDIRQDTANQLTELGVQLAVEKEENSSLKDIRQRLEYRLEEMDKQILEMMVDKEDLEHKVAALQNDNAYLSATLAREKERLGRLVEMMRMEVEAFRMEAELSRNCLEDLRQNNNNPQDQRPIREMLTNRSWEKIGGGSQVRAYSQPPEASTHHQQQRRDLQSTEKRRAEKFSAQAFADQLKQDIPAKSSETTSVSIDLAKIGNWEMDCCASVTAIIPDINKTSIVTNIIENLPAALVNTTALEFFQSHPAPAKPSAETFESAVQCELIKEIVEKPLRTRSHTMDGMSFHKTSRLIRTVSTDDENANKDIELNIPNILTDAKMASAISPHQIRPTTPKASPPKTVSNQEAKQTSLLMSCVEEAANLEEHFTANVNQLLELNSQLETAVDVLKSEIWSLNNQLRKVQLTEHEELLNQLQKSDSLLLAAHLENTTLKSELKKKEEFISQLQSDFELKNAELLQIQLDKSRLEEKSSDLAQKLLMLEQQWQEQEGLASQLKEAHSLLTDSQSRSQALEMELAEKEALVIDLKLRFEQKAEELVDIQMDKLKIEQESSALTERFNELKFSYEQLIAKDRCDQSMELAQEAQQPAFSEHTACKGCDTTTNTSSTTKKGVVIASNSSLSDPNLQLAILAARLVAKSQDNDSLFRVNAELVHSNVELQNAVGVLEDKIKGMSESSENEDNVSSKSNKFEKQGSEEPGSKNVKEGAVLAEEIEKADFSSHLQDGSEFKVEEKTDPMSSYIYPKEECVDPNEDLWAVEESWQRSVDKKEDVQTARSQDSENKVQTSSYQNAEKSAPPPVKSDAEDWNSNWDDDSNWGDDDGGKEAVDERPGAHIVQKVEDSKRVEENEDEQDEEEEEENDDGNWDW